MVDFTQNPKGVNVMKNSIQRFPGLTVVMLVFASLLITGCSKTDLATEVKDTRGVTLKSPVISGDKMVGHVEKVVSEPTGYRLHIRLEDRFRKTFKEGLMACPVPVGKLSPVPALFLIEGGDATAPLLKRGAVIPEAPLLSPDDPLGDESGLWGRIKKPMTICLTVLPLLIFVIKLIKGFIKLALVVILALALLYGVYGVKQGWTLDKVREAIPTDNVKKWILENKEFIVGLGGTLIEGVKTN